MKSSFTLTLTGLAFRCNLLISIGCLKTCKIQSDNTFVKRLSVKGKKKSSSFAFWCNLLISIGCLKACKISLSLLRKEFKI